jgi:hypothetical protein
MATTTGKRSLKDADLDNKDELETRVRPMRKDHPCRRRVETDPLTTDWDIKAAEAGNSVLFDTATNRIDRLARAHHTGALEAELKKIRRYKRPAGGGPAQPSSRTRTRSQGPQARALRGRRGCRSTPARSMQPELETSAAASWDGDARTADGPTA